MTTHNQKVPGTGMSFIAGDSVQAKKKFIGRSPPDDNTGIKFFPIYGNQFGIVEGPSEEYPFMLVVAFELGENATCRVEVDSTLLVRRISPRQD